jgi:PKD repeat protein
MKVFASVAAALTVVAFAGCTVHKTEAPGLTGPSELALSVSVTATPDAISQDGGSQSSIKVTAKQADGRAVAAQPFRVDMQVNGVMQDFGTLSARTIVTGTDGVASVVYTAPPTPVGPSLGGTCAGLPGTCVTIVAAPTGTNFATVNPQSVTLRLVPPGVILPPADTPTPKFSVTPTPVQINIPATFDGSKSCPGPADSGGNCLPSSSAAITSYSWNFGDGGTGTGVTASHSYTATGTFNATLTVTNDRGLSASTTQAVTVGVSAAPAGDWVNSPVSPAVGDSVTFNADKVLPAPGRTIVQYSWNFGDGTTGSGVVTTHVYTTANQYVVVLSVLDDAGQKTVISHNLTVTSGSPVPVITFSPGAPRVGATVTFDATGTSTTGGATITSFAWTFGDGASSTGSTVSHAFATAGSFTVRVVATDNQGRTGSATVTVTVTP